MEPNLHLNILAITAAAAWGFALGGLWYSPALFGQRWAAHVGLDNDEGRARAKKAMVKAMLGFALAQWLIPFCMAHNLAAWTPASWVPGGAQATWQHGLMAGFWTWAGFIFPVQLGVTLFELRKPGYLAINATYYLLNVLGMGLILSLWK